jgi:hypothetical protein
MGISLIKGSSSFDTKTPSRAIGAPCSPCSYSKDKINYGKIEFHPYKDIEQIKERLCKLESANSQQPRADKYKIESSIQVGKNLVLIIVYKNCTNYEGKKVLVYKDISQDRLMEINNRLIDPHFSDNPNFVSPVARFEPTDKGIMMAFKFAKEIL